MKIDVHVHTKKIKKGDPPSREVTPERFAEVVLSTDVKIIAITNHNVFDLEQYNLILEQVEGEVQVWPGIEIDILDDNKRSHLLIIVSPNTKHEFYSAVKSVTEKSDPDSFTLSINETVECFDKFNPIYIIHYLQKKPDISEGSLTKLSDLVSNKKRIIKEASNSISAGIFIAHGHASIYGSDVQDWDDYGRHAILLPELRLPVESYEHFCLLLEKDVAAINTVIDKKTTETLVLKPFEDNTEVKLKVFNDINVIFGPKGTGKSRILEAISKYYSSKGIHATVFESGADNLESKYDFKGKLITKNLNQYSINYCTDEIKRIKESQEVDITSLQKYLEFYRSESRNKKAKLIRIKDLANISETGSKKAYEEYSAAYKQIESMIEYLSTSRPISEVAEDERIENIVDQLRALAVDLKIGMWRHFSEWKSTSLTNSASRLFRDEVARKTGTLTKPTSTGFSGYAMNRIRIKVDSMEILRNIAVEFPDEPESVGSLGPEKGELKCVTSFLFHNGSIRDSRYSPIKDIKKGALSQFSKCLIKIEESAVTDNLFSNVRDLNEIEDVDRIETVYELMLFWRRFDLDGAVYEPSTGECSMLNLHAELAEDKEVYILDEPEKSLGNEYINDVIIPQINDKARQGKKVFIATHDANIAVRTLPYNSVYRCHDRAGYSTYVGNPFSNNLVNLDDQDDILDWKKISMRTLEGGETAFGDRGKIYEND